jgi:hypothetical protein
MNQQRRGESIAIRDVSDIESDERRMYESVLDHDLQVSPWMLLSPVDFGR